MPRIPITDEYSLTKRKGSARWYLEWREHGQKIQRATGTACLESAKARARDLILAGAEVRDAKPAEIALADVIERYRLQRGENLPSKEMARRGCALWIEFWGSRPVSDITVQRQEQFTAWLQAKGFSQGYVRRVLGVGKAALNRAWKRGELATVPFVELPPIGEGYPHYATRDQLVKLLNTPMPEHVFAYCVVRLCTGCRGDAALDLQPFQIDRDARLIRLNPPHRLQTKKYRPVVPLTDTLAKYLKDASPTAHVVNWKGKHVASIKTTWRKIRIAAGLPEWFAPKVLRHTVATELRRRGVPDWEASGMLGHRKGGTTEIYAKFDPAYLGKARKALDAWLRDLARDVPRLHQIGVSSGSVGADKETARTRESRAVPRFQVVGGTGIEPVTPTMSRSQNTSKIKH